MDAAWCRAYDQVGLRQNGAALGAWMWWGDSSEGTNTFDDQLGAKRKLHQLDGAESDTEDDMEWLDMAEQEVGQRFPHVPAAIAVRTDADNTNASVVLDFTQPLILQTGDAEIIDASPAQNAGDDDEGTQADAEGSGEGEERGIHDDEEEEKEAEDRPSSPADSTASTSFLVSASDLAPVSGLSGINLPLQLAAEYSSFNHRGKRRGYVGQLHAIVLTWPSRLGAREPIRPGELVWCCPDSEQALLHEGELVKVRSLGDSLKDVRVELSNGWEATVRLDRVRRLKEYLIRKGSVRLRSEQ
jgi:hypothetical protein